MSGLRSRLAGSSCSTEELVATTPERSHLDSVGAKSPCSRGIGHA